MFDSRIAFSLYTVFIPWEQAAGLFPGEALLPPLVNHLPGDGLSGALQKPPDESEVHISFIA